MEANALFTLALNLEGTPWRVVSNGFEGEPSFLELRLDFERGSRFLCPECGELCPVHDSAERRWRHLNFFQYRCDLVARLPRIHCEKHGVLQPRVPWAREGSGFTLLFEAVVVMLATQMPVNAVARMAGEQDTRLWRLIEHHVAKAHAQVDWSEVRAVAVDETSAKRGHRYVTLFSELGSNRLLFMAEGRASDTVGAFVAALRAHGGRPENIRTVVMDMSPAYAAGVAQEFPEADIVYDRFHLMRLAGEAVEEVRKDLQRQGAPLKGHLWALRGNEWTRTEEQLRTRQALAVRYRPLGRALALRGALQQTLDSPAEEGPAMLKLWCAWATRSRLEAFRALAKTIKKHWHGIVAYFKHRFTQGAAEALNGIVQLAKRRARGYRSFRYFRTIAYLIKGSLHLDLPSPLPT